VIKRFEELNEHYDGTTNQIHFLSFTTDISSNEVFTYKEAMNQEDKHLFVDAMQKEVADHESRDHWTIVPCSTVPKTAKPIQAIWSFKRKRRPDGTLVKHKARLCAHGGMQQWGTNYWETYSPVVNMVTVRLILLLARIYKLDSKAIAFVLEFPQTSFCKVHEDHQSTIKMSTSEKFTPSTKHIALKYHHFCSHVKKGHIEINYCPTEDQKADFLTNPLEDSAFFRLRHMLIGW